MSSDTLPVNTSVKLTNGTVILKIDQQPNGNHDREFHLPDEMVSFKASHDAGGHGGVIYDDVDTERNIKEWALLHVANEVRCLWTDLQRANVMLNTLTTEEQRKNFNHAVPFDAPTEDFGQIAAALITGLAKDYE